MGKVVRTQTDFCTVFRVMSAVLFATFWKKNEALVLKCSFFSNIFYDKTWNQIKIFILIEIVPPHRFACNKRRQKPSEFLLWDEVGENKWYPLRGCGRHRASKEKANASIFLVVRNYPLHNSEVGRHIQPKKEKRFFTNKFASFFF